MVADGGAVMKTIMTQRSANSLVNIAHSGKFLNLASRSCLKTLHPNKCRVGGGVTLASASEREIIRKASI
jgi:hypothetical protein